MELFKLTGVCLNCRRVLTIKFGGNKDTFDSETYFNKISSGIMHNCGLDDKTFGIIQPIRIDCSDNVKIVAKNNIIQTAHPGITIDWSED